MTDLSLIPMDDLVEEINKRCDGVLLITERAVDSGEPVVEARFHGGNVRACGLAETAKSLCLNKIMRTMTDVDSED